MDLEELEKYKITITDLFHEDHLIHERVAWLAAAQAFLFTALAALFTGQGFLKDTVFIKDPDFLQKYEELFHILYSAIPSIGLISSLLAYITIIAGIGTFFLKRDITLEQVKKANIEHLRLNRRSWKILIGFSVPLVVPLLLISIWVLVVIVIQPFADLLTAQTSNLG